MTGLYPSLAATAGILILAAGAGGAGGRGFLPKGARAAERVAWAFALGMLLLASYVPLAFAAGVRPGWFAFSLLCAVFVAAGRRLFPRPPEERDGGSGRPGISRGTGGAGPRVVEIILGLLLVVGLLLYLLRALTEPMWAADFLAIWGWKGKTIFGAAALPAWTWQMPRLAFTHPEYPLGLPLLYSGIAFLLGRWDDHAMALLFPALQAATAALLAGWLRRRGATPAIALAAASALSLFEPLYRAFTTGMAEVPLSFFLLLLGTALVDALEGEPLAVRRLVLASAGLASIKNEGLFAAGAAFLLALSAAETTWRTRLRIAAGSLLPALIVVGAHRLGRGPLALRDFDFGMLASPEITARLLLGLRTILDEAVLPAAPGLIGFAAILWAGLPSRAGRRLLALVAIAVAAYALLPAVCVLGPDWLARTAFARTASALAPLAAAGAAMRLSPLFAPSGESNESSASPGG